MHHLCNPKGSCVRNKAGWTTAFRYIFTCQPFLILGVRTVILASLKIILIFPDKCLPSRCAPPSQQFLFCWPWSSLSLFVRLYVIVLSLVTCLAGDTDGTILPAVSPLIDRRWRDVKLCPQCPTSHGTKRHSGWNAACKKKHSIWKTLLSVKL